ncbi:MAG: 2Fe-2S iron-sulfur cluster-binding protein [candidate division WOR-3 bacterium]
MVNIVINGEKYTAKKGETVLEVCRREGIYIPTLCYQENLTPYGGCRLCIVEVEGNPRPMTACTLPAQNGMVIKTDTPLLQEIRKFTLQLILSEHPYSCLICDKTKDCANYMECIEKEPITFGCKYCSANGTCELQKLVEEFGIKEIPFTFRYRNLPIEDYDPFFERDYNLCILCGRCVRACAELRAAYVIDFHHRGPKTLVGTPFNLSHIDANCQFCGACVDACPTGAMRERYNKYLGKCEKEIKTHCMLCSMGCEIVAEVNGNGLIRTRADKEPLCVRGRFGIAPIVNHPKRVTTPLVKRNGQLIEISYDDAIEIAGNILKEYQGKTGVIFSPDLTMETITALNTFSEIMGVEELGAEINTSGSFDEICLDRPEKKIALFVLNVDLINDFSVFLLHLRKFLNEKPVVIVVDPIQTRIADFADLWLRPDPGKEWQVLDYLLSSDKLTDFAGIKKQEFIDARRLIKNREVCILYNPNNIIEYKCENKLKCFPLVSNLNHTFLSKANILRATDVINNSSIECLYLIGATIPKTKKYKKVIVQDCFLPEFDFDLFLPAATFIEVDGSFIDFKGKEKRLHKVVEPKGSSRPDEWIIKSIVERTDFERIKSEVAPETDTSKSDRNKTKGESLTKDYPFYLIIRENGFRFRNRRLSDILTGFRRVHQDRVLWINPEDTKKLRIKNGERVKVVTEDSEIEMEILVTEKVPMGYVFAYYNRENGLIESQRVRIEGIR